MESGDESDKSPHSKFRAGGSGVNRGQAQEIRGQASIDLANLLIYCMTMIRLNIHEIKSQFSKYVDLVESGETIVVCKRNLPVAELRPIHEQKKRKPVLGAAKGTFKISSSFYKPLPEGLLRAFEGEAGKVKR